MTASATVSAPPHVNEVHLVGRLAAEPARRELPSGDVLVSFRLVVSRPPGRKRATERSPTVDTLDCAAWRRDVQRTPGPVAAGRRGRVARQPASQVLAAPGPRPPAAARSR